MGGSVARQFAVNATDLLSDELATCPEFVGWTCQFVRLAGDGYKQPQQLMTLIYMLSLGAEFDVLINLDGQNEAVLPKIDNSPFGLNSAFAGDWGKLTGMHASPEFMRVAGHVTFLRHQQRGYARWAETFPCVYSPAAQLIWRFRDDQLEQELTERMSALATLTQQKLTYVSPGPPEHFHSSQELYEHCVELWCRSSIVLNQVCTANEIRYFHFLQPNQYLPGAKPIGPMETRVALKEGSATDLAVKACYPLMQAQSERLLQAGVAFTDLTGVFADHPEPIYNDNCCHMERKGDLIMARAMAAHIKQWVAKSPQSCGHRQRGPHEVRFATQGQAAP